MDVSDASKPDSTRRFIASGRVHPERADVRFIPVELRDSKGNITVSCDASQLTIVVERSDFGDVHSAHIG